MTDHRPKGWRLNGLDVSASEPQAKIMLARYYSAQLGRFTSVDPVRSEILALPQSWNKYIYTRNNPIRFNDPAGTDTRDPIAMAGVSNFVGMSLSDDAAEPGTDGARNPARELKKSVEQRRKASQDSVQDAPYDPAKYGPPDPTNPSRPMSENPIVKKAGDKAWMMIENGEARLGLAEAGFAIEYKDGKLYIGPMVSTVHESGPANVLNIPVNVSTTRAVYHVQGNNLTAAPSPVDLASKYPNFVRSRRELWVTVPGENRAIRLKLP